MSEKPKEKIYSFTVSKGGGIVPIDYEKTESELTDIELSLLEGEMLLKLEELPEKSKKRLYQHLKINYEKTTNT